MAATLNVYYGLSAWANSTYASGALVSSGGNAYVTPNGGSSTAAPTGNGTNINNGGTATWNFVSTIDYTTMQAAYNSIPATPTQSYFIDVVVASGTITTTPGATILNATGKATTSTNSITVRAKPGYSFRDNLFANAALPLAYNSTNGAAIQLPSSGAGGVNYINISDSFVTFDGFQIKDPLATSNSTIINAGATFVLQNCIIDGFSQGGGADILQGGLTGASTSTITIRNCLIIDRGTSGAAFAKTLSTNYSATIANNTIIFAGTFVSGQQGLQNTGSSGSAFKVINNAIFGYDAGAIITADSGGTATASFNVVSVGSFTDGGVTTGASNVFGATAANQFTSATTDFRLKIGSACLNTASTDTTDVPSATDILGRARPQGAGWDVGAYEMPAAAATGSASGVATVVGVGTALARSVGTISAAATAAGVAPTGGVRTVTAAGVATVSGVGSATSVGTGTAAGTSNVAGLGLIGSIATTITIDPVPPQAALQPFPVTGSLTLVPQLQFTADSGPAFTPIPPSGISPLTGARFEFTHPGTGLGSHILTLQDLTTGATGATSVVVDSIGGKRRPFPPLEQTSLTTIIPSYLYQEYFDDDDLQAFVATYNDQAQSELDYLNALGLPIYTQLSGPMLDWVAEGLYGIVRPTIALTHLVGIGPFNTWPINTLPFNAGTAQGGTKIFDVTDEIFKRIITWHFYKGDGKQFTIRWLKRRFARFLAGVSGTAPEVADTSQISVKFTSKGHVAVTISKGLYDMTYAPVLQAAILAGTLPLPFSIVFDVLIQ